MGDSSRTLLLVLGRRSGTSALAGILSSLGFRVPKPEVRPDATNPRGFGESRWVVDYHDRLLATSRVHISDGRPDAWFRTAKIGLANDVLGELGRFLDRQFTHGDAVVIKDPRLVWFLPAWRNAGQQVGARVSAVTMLRHPAAAVGSAQKWYASTGYTDANRAVSWVNVTLGGERATRELPRAYLRYDDLLADWSKAVFSIGEALDLEPVRNASMAQLRRSHDFLDTSLRRSADDWGELAVPQPVRALAEQTFAQTVTLGNAGGDTAAARAALDTTREAYRRLYTAAEAIAQSSVGGGPRRKSAPSGELSEALRALYLAVPADYRARIPEPARRQGKALLRRALRGRPGALRALGVRPSGLR